MALKIDKKTDEGLTVSYWRVCPTIAYDIEKQILHATVMAYADETARQEGKRDVNVHSEEFMEVAHIVLSGTDATDALAMEDPRDAIYTHIKTLDFFTKAIDVIDTEDAKVKIKEKKGKQK